MDRSGSRPSCPEAEALAAWIDGAVDDSEARWITAHVANCDDCRTVVAGVLSFQRHGGAQPEGTPAAVQPVPAVVAAPPPKARSRWRWGAGAVAAAAVLIAALQPAGRVSRLWTSAPDLRFIDLVEAVGEERTTEARLTGGFAFGEMRDAYRGSGDSDAVAANWSLLAAAGRIRAEAEKEPIAANLHGLGVAHLLLGEHDAAVGALEQAVTSSPKVARYQNDLAAAYMARAQDLSRPDDLPRALSAAERAVELDGTITEARFNRALALERLYLVEQARAAWTDYIAREPNPAWADEGRKHLAELPAIAQDPIDHARGAPPPDIGPDTIDDALYWVLRVGLPQWADALSSSDGAAQKQAHDTLLGYAVSLSDAADDPFAAAVVRTLKPTEETADAVRHFAEGLRADSVNDTPLAEREMSQACPHLAAPLSAYCDARVGILAAIRTQRGAVDVDRLIARAEEGRFAYLQAYGLRLKGWHAGLEGRFAEAVPPYIKAFERFRTGHYESDAAFVAQQIGEWLELQGLTQSSWQWRLTALRLGIVSGNRLAIHTGRNATAHVLRRHGLLDAALLFVADDGPPGPTTLPTLMRVQRERARLAVLLELDHTAAAGTTIDEMDRRLKADGQDFRSARIGRELVLLRAQVAASRGDYAAADALLSEAIATLDALRTPQRASALLARSLARTRLGQSTAAETDLLDGLQLLTSRTAAQADQALQLTDASAAFDAVAALSRSRADRQDASGLLLLERLRELLDATPRAERIATGEQLSAVLQRLTPEQSLVYYLFSSDHRLLVWVASAGNVTFHDLPVSEAQVGDLVNQLTVQVTRAPAQEPAWRATLARLHELLLGPLPGLGRDLVIVPDGPLNRVPFGSLVDSASDRFLFEERSVRMAPNAALALRSTRADAAGTSGERALVVGEPALMGVGSRAFGRLPRANTEAMMVASLYGQATLLTGVEATRDRVQSALPASDILHFAGHAVLTSTTGGARLLLAGSIDDPANTLTIGASSDEGSAMPGRVILAACGTGDSVTDRSSGVASLAATFLRAGTRSVVGTLWPVEDRASQEFFVTLHRQLVKGGSMAAAVAAAQQTCRASGACRASVATWLGTTTYGAL